MKDRSSDKKLLEKIQTQSAKLYHVPVVIKHTSSYNCIILEMLIVGSLLDISDRNYKEVKSSKFYIVNDIIFFSCNGLSYNTERNQGAVARHDIAQNSSQSQLG